MDAKDCSSRPETQRRSRTRLRFSLRNHTGGRNWRTRLLSVRRRSSPQELWPTVTRRYTRVRMREEKGVVCKDLDSPDDPFAAAERSPPRHHLSLSARRKCWRKPMGRILQVLSQTRMGSPRCHSFSGTRLPNGRWGAPALSRSPHNIGGLVSRALEREPGTYWHRESF